MEERDRYYVKLNRYYNIPCKVGYKKLIIGSLNDNQLDDLKKHIQTKISKKIKLNKEEEDQLKAVRFITRYRYIKRTNEVKQIINTDRHKRLTQVANSKADHIIKYVEKLIDKNIK